MASVSTYLNFDGECEAAFELYKSVFGADSIEFSRYGEMPPSEDMVIDDADKDRILNVELTMMDGHALRGSDILAQYGDDRGFVKGTNSYICLTPDSREEADRLFAALSEGGQVEMQLEEMFWGDYFGSCADKFGVQWMINTSAK